jgi:uncharacterized protein (DUF983 family)
MAANITENAIGKRLEWLDLTLVRDAALEDGDPYLVIAALGDIARSKAMTIPLHAELTLWL